MHHSPDAFRRPRMTALFSLLLALTLSGCGSMVQKAGQRFAGNLSAAMLDNDDPATVASGAPSYLLLLDAMVRQNPDSAGYRRAAADLNSAYAGAFVKDTPRAARMTEKALAYAVDAICLQQPGFCQVRKMPLEALQQQLAAAGSQDVPQLYSLGTTWAGWIQAHSEDFLAVADVPRVQAILERVVALDEGYQDGAAHLYLGVIAMAIPPMLGGHPEVGKAHFEKAIALSGGHNLMAKVYYAKSYARVVYDRDLHDRLLQEVKAADPHWPGWTLSNVLAQQEADALLQSADDYF